MSWSSKLLAFAVVAAAVGEVAPASAMTPAATGTVRYASTGAAWMGFEAFEDSANPFGFFLRFRNGGDKVMTVTPFATEADGTVSFWFIEYSLVGTTDPDTAEGWQFVEVAGGRMSLDPATAGSASIDGTLTWTWQKVGYSKVDITAPTPVPVRLSIP